MVTAALLYNARCMAEGELLLVRDTQAVSRTVAGERIIVPVRANVADLESIYTLNETATFIWDQLEGSLTESALVDRVVAEFEIEREVAAADVARVIEELCQEKLVQRVATPK